MRRGSGRERKGRMGRKKRKIRNRRERFKKCVTRKMKTIRK